ncbi:MAG: hypothetical protein A2Z18_00605 [Armatimonadetes bacterium RBG_16_58_9]|nr:MAG: hypothetical protein A2Z18_00605 [Armatimonadetes bacterium RBG_16_58_9]
MVDWAQGTREGYTMAEEARTVRSDDIKRMGDSYTYDGVQVHFLRETKERLERGENFGLKVRPFYNLGALLWYDEV